MSFPVFLFPHPPVLVSLPALNEEGLRGLKDSERVLPAKNLPNLIATCRKHSKHHLCGLGFVRWRQDDVIDLLPNLPQDFTPKPHVLFVDPCPMAARDGHEHCKPQNHISGTVCVRANSFGEELKS